MPYLLVRISGVESEALTQQVSESLLTLTTEILKKKRALTAIVVDYVTTYRWVIGGQAVSEPPVSTFSLEILVTEGTNTKDEKANYIAAVFSAMQSALGRLHPASYVAIKDVPGDSWGYEGLTQECRYVLAKQPLNPAHSGSSPKGL